LLGHLGTLLINNDKNFLERVVKLFFITKLKMVEDKDALVRALVLKGIENHRLLVAFHKVDRKFFVPKEFEDEAYKDVPISIGHGVTISSPYIHAITIEASLPPMCAKGCADNGDSNQCMRRSCGKVLEIGSGSGFETSLLAMIYDSVDAIEYIPEIADLGRRNAQNFAKFLRETGKERYAEKLDKIMWFQGDGFNGLESKSPFDTIIVSAGARFVPQPLKNQLKIGGTLIGPFGPENDQKLMKIVRTGKNSWEETVLLQVRFVPFVSEHFKIPHTEE
jgi:protein-L-isoaspartate(D-aspartate) O-methyltransferase